MEIGARFGEAGELTLLRFLWRDIEKPIPDWHSAQRESGLSAETFEHAVRSLERKALLMVHTIGNDKWGIRYLGMTLAGHEQAESTLGPGRGERVK